MAYYEGPVEDGPLAGTKMGQWGMTHEVVIKGKVVRYQFDGGSWWQRIPEWDAEGDGWAKARTGV